MASLSGSLRFPGHQLPNCKLKIIVMSIPLKNYTVLNVSESWVYLHSLHYIHSFVGDPRCSLLIHSGNFLELTAQKFNNLIQNLTVAKSSDFKGKKEKALMIVANNSEVTGS